MERNTVVGHRKESGIGDNPSGFVWAHLWMEYRVGVCGGMVLCGCGGDLEANTTITFQIKLII